jgi:hypothetical protein
MFYLSVSNNPVESVILISNNCNRRPVFDSNTDTYAALHERSPFAVDCICMVAARVRDGGGKLKAKSLASRLIVPDQASETYSRILEEVQAISCATLFAPVMSSEAVQAMSTLFYPEMFAEAYAYASTGLWLV